MNKTTCDNATVLIIEGLSHPDGRWKDRWESHSHWPGSVVSGSGAFVRTPLRVPHVPRLLAWEIPGQTAGLVINLLALVYSVDIPRICY